MRTLICPTSPLRVDETTVRITALLIVALLGLYIASGNLACALLVVVDFYVRAFTRRSISPVSWTAARIARTFDLTARPIAKAPKVFAARVGLLFAAATLVLYVVSIPASILAGSILIGFALLEALLNVCVGCLVYTYLVLPRFRSTV